MAAMNDKDYYAILGVDKEASTEEIRKAFQTKARKLHPDVNKEPDAEERFKEVSEAYAVLSDPDKRKRYDAMRSGAPFAGAGYGSAGGSPYNRGYGYGQYGWGPFGSGFGTGQRRSSSRAYRPRVGADVEVEASVDAATAAKGARRGVTFQRYVRCDACAGKGSVESEHPETCPTCAGRGRIAFDTGLFGVMEVTCPECEGTGRVVADPCDVCGGSGRTLSASEVVIDIPAGSHDGDEIRIKGMGNAGTNGSAAGDFVARVVVPEERLSQRQAGGFNLIGLALPFLVLGLLSGTLQAMLAFVVILIVAGLVMAFRDGLRHDRRWWRNAGVAIANGASNGLVMAFIVTMMFSCTSGAWGMGYMRY